MEMFKKLTDMIRHKATWTKAFAWLISSQAIYFYMLYVTIPMVEKQANGMKIFDLLPLGYTPEYAVNLLQQLGEQGRETYLTDQIPLDLFYPGLMGVAGAFFIALLTKRVNSRIHVLLYLPLLAAFFDYLENGMISLLLLSFPHISDGIIGIASSFTILKSLLTTLYIGVLVVLFLFFLKTLFYRTEERRMKR